jgi:thiamine pyrophosphokinase
LSGRILHRADRPVTLVGGGPVAPGRLAEALRLAPEAVAADGGADVVLPAPHDWRAVIGDMDSIRGTAALRRRGVPVHAIEEQESTDLEKCLYSVEAPLFLGLGFLGGRLDHHLAAMSALVKYGHKPAVLVGGEDLCFLCPADFEIALEPGTRVSLYPMGRVTGLRGEGLRWPVEGLEMAPHGRIGTSNVATGPIRLGFDAPRMLVILPGELLERVVAALKA